MHAGDTTWLFAADNGGTAALEALRATAACSRRGTTTMAARAPSWPAGSCPVTTRAAACASTCPDSGREVATLACGSGHYEHAIVIDSRIALQGGERRPSTPTSGVLNIWRMAGRSGSA